MSGSSPSPALRSISSFIDPSREGLRCFVYCTVPVTSTASSTKTFDGPAIPLDQTQHKQLTYDRPWKRGHRQPFPFFTFNVPLFVIRLTVRFRLACFTPRSRTATQTKHTSTIPSLTLARNRTH